MDRIDYTGQTDIRSVLDRIDYTGQTAISPVLRDLGRMLEDYIRRKGASVGEDVISDERRQTKTRLFAEIALKLYKQGGTLTYDDILEISKQFYVDEFFETTYRILKERGGKL